MLIELTSEDECQGDFLDDPDHAGSKTLMVPSGSFTAITAG
jgi:hypothetical protein